MPSLRAAAATAAVSRVRFLSSFGLRKPVIMRFAPVRHRAMLRQGRYRDRPIGRFPVIAVKLHKYAAQNRPPGPEARHGFSDKRQWRAGRAFPSNWATMLRNCITSLRCSGVQLCLARRETEAGISTAGKRPCAAMARSSTMWPSSVPRIVSETGSL